MDLKALLEKNKSKIGQKPVEVKKPLGIADQHRPYSHQDTIIDTPTPPPCSANLSSLTFVPSSPIASHQSIKEEKVELEMQKTSHRNITNELETNLGQTKDKVKTKPKAQLAANIEANNLGQSWDKLKTSKLLVKLSGLQKNILLFIYDECQIVLDAETAPLTIEYVANACKSSISSVRKTIQRMIIKGFLIRTDYKDGRGGWTKYQLPENIYQEINHLRSTKKLETNPGQTRDKVRSQLETQPRTNASSSSSNLININKTTTELNNEWNFDISPYNRFGFTMTQLKQLASLGISAANVEQSLIEFNYDFENGSLPPIKTTKINFLMGLLRAGHTYVSEGFKNEQEAMITEMARRAAEKRESLLKAKFEAWEVSLTEDERIEIERQLPVHLIAPFRMHGASNQEVKQQMMTYFLNKK